MTPLSKAKRATLFNPYKKEVGDIADRIQKTLDPDVYYYSVEDKQVEVMSPMSFDYQQVTYKDGSFETKEASTNNAYPVARYMEEEDIQFCADMNVFLKQVRKTKPTTSVLLVSVGGILASAILVKPRKTSNKGFA